MQQNKGHIMRMIIILTMALLFAAMPAHAGKCRNYPYPWISTKELRNPATVREFRKTHPCPSTGLTTGACKGWVVDHIIPLECTPQFASRAPLDVPSNMQWQTMDASKLKDRWEICGDSTHVPCSGLPE